ncbi:hypothetical protein [Rhizobium leguminosarum]|uniref:hypothetical protein n=1 Tax=Rhizobium leguminosarum TaxID=384 RepID=UPI0013DCE163|nr:hypothetical protein [Rhizobium leguminosarum]NEK34821.1 hypothetical protein [Rhizobium leguminosarum]
MSFAAFRSVVVLFFYIATACASVQADGFASIFGVQIFLAGSPPCVAENRFVRLDVTISSFQPSLPIDVVVAEMAREAKARGADMVYDIQLNSFAAGEGANASAIIGKCLHRSNDALLE